MNKMKETNVLILFWEYENQSQRGM